MKEIRNIIVLYLALTNVCFSQTINGWTNMSGASISVSSGMLAISSSGVGQLGASKQASAMLQLGVSYEFTALIDKGTCNSSSIIEARIVDSVGSIIVSEQFTTTGINSLQASFSISTAGTYFMEFERIGSISSCTFYINKIKLTKIAVITEVCNVPVGQYRYGYQGSEKDNEISSNGNSYTTFFRQLDPRLGRWLSVDPKNQITPWESPYANMGNDPIRLTDKRGDTWVDGNGNEVKVETEVLDGGFVDVSFTFAEGTSLDDKLDFVNSNYSTISAMAQTDIGRESIQYISDIPTEVEIKNYTGKDKSFYAETTLKGKIVKDGETYYKKATIQINEGAILKDVNEYGIKSSRLGFVTLEEGIGANAVHEAVHLQPYQRLIDKSEKGKGSWFRKHDHRSQTIRSEFLYMKQYRDKYYKENPGKEVKGWEKEMFGSPPMPYDATKPKENK